MAYCTNADVTTYTGVTYSTSTQPADTEVDGIIASVSGSIDGALSSIGISTVSSTKLTDLLKMPCSLGAAGLSVQRRAQNENEFAKGDWLYGKFEAWFDKLIKDADYRDMISKLENGATSSYGMIMSSPAVDGTFNSTDYDNKYLNEDFEA